MIVTACPKGKLWNRLSLHPGDTFLRKKRRWNRETKALNGHTKRQRYLPCQLLRNTSAGNFFWRQIREWSVADRGDIHIIIGDKNLIAFISLLFIQKKCIQKIIFLKKVCLGVGFPSQVSSSRESGKCKGRVMHQWINYANVGFILLQPTKGFRFQKNKNVRFNSGNFSPERFLWKVKQYDVVYIFFYQQTLTESVFRIYHIETHVIFRIKIFCLRSLQMIIKQNLDK